LPPPDERVPPHPQPQAKHGPPTGDRGGDGPEHVGERRPPAAPVRQADALPGEQRGHQHGPSDDADDVHAPSSAAVPCIRRDRPHTRERTTPATPVPVGARPGVPASGPAGRYRDPSRSMLTEEGGRAGAPRVPGVAPVTPGLTFPTPDGPPRRHIPPKGRIPQRGGPFKL